MDAELLELQRELEAAQSARSTVRLSERNVVELVQKLQDRRFLDFDLLHTVSGKEYITPDQLRIEIEMEIKKSGRVSLIDLSDIIGMDLYHIERQSQSIVAADLELMLVNGEIISQAYWDNMTEEINDKLQECSQISLAEIAAQFHIGSELVVNILEPRLGTLVKGRLEGGQLYTPAYVSRITAMVRGAARGITVPTNLTTVWSSLQQLLQDSDGASGVSVEGSFFQSIFNALLKDSDILGSIRAGVHWTPAVFAHAQKESVDSFFSQNSYIGYEVLQKLAIPQPKQYLQTRYPEGILLDGVFVHPSIVEMLDAAVGDAVEHGNWIDCLSVLPTYITGSDASKILSMCPSMQKAIKSSTAVILGEHCVFSNTFVKVIFDQLEKEMDAISIKNASSQVFPVVVQSTHEPKVGANAELSIESKDLGENDSASTYVSEKGPKKKKGKGTGSAKKGTVEEDMVQDNPSKSKKNQRRNKDAGSSSGKKGLDRVKEESSSIVSDEWILQRVITLLPDLEEIGDCEDTVGPLRQLCSHLRPMLLQSWTRRRNTMLSENAGKRRLLLDNLQKQVDQAVVDMQLYEKSLCLFEDDVVTSAILHKHMLKVMGSSIVDKLLCTLDKENKMKNGILTEDDVNEPATLSPSERASLAKGLPGSLSNKAHALVEAVEGKHVGAFLDALSVFLEESGLLMKKLDKRLERTMLHSYKKDLMMQVSSETDPVAILPKVVSLLFLQAYNKALHAPGRAISSVIAKIKGKISDSTYKVLMDYHGATVKLLQLQAAAVGDEFDCSTDRILRKKELLDSMMPDLKAAVLGSAETQRVES